jgi:FAD/FMN-containing dehydrogenase
MTTQKFLGSTGKAVWVERGAVERDLRARLAGPTLAGSDAGYDEARTLWNAMIDRRPALVARCADASDVQQCVRFAREHGIALTVRGAGHNIGGRGVADDGLMIDLSPRRTVRVDAAERIAHVAPGATLGDVDRATAPHGLVVPSGIVSETGIAGLALGGGFGWLSRRYGLTCDHLVGAEIVTGDGEIVSATEESHPDLLWALRGGGGGCGIATSFRFRTLELDPMVTAGLQFVGADRIEDALLRFRECTEGSPEDLGCAMKLGLAPPAPFLPEPLRGQLSAATLVCHHGDPRDVDRDIAVLRRDPKPVADVIERRPFVAFQSMLDPGEPKGRRYYWKSEYIDRLDDPIIAAALDAMTRMPSPHANIKVFHLGGAVARVGPEATSAGHRDARYIVAVGSAWEDPAHDEANVAWVRATWQRVHEHSRRGGYINFLTEDSSADERETTRGGVDLTRLAAIVKRYDPDAIFRGGGWSS